jgi:hypothetical protein
MPFGAGSANTKLLLSLTFPYLVIAGLDPAIHHFAMTVLFPWMRRSSPRMKSDYLHLLVLV